MSSRGYGLLATTGAVILFGVFPLPTKTHVSGDGLFYQLCMCAGIWSVASVVHFAQCSAEGGCPAFIPLSALGGAIWCLSNLLLVPIVNTVGVGLCMLVWGSAEMLTGWATGRFGLFGLHSEPVSSAWMNYGGVALGLASLLVLGAVSPAVADGSDKVPEAPKSLEDEGDAEAGKQALLPVPAAGSLQEPAPASAGAPSSAWETNGYDPTVRLSPAGKRVFGLTASLVAGTLSGSTFTPPQYVVDHAAAFPGASTRLMDHLWAHHCGILLASVLFFVLYCAATRNRPWVSAQLALPAYLSGVCWGCAMVCWFTANQLLEIVIAFPCVTLGPGVINMVIGAVAFNEVQGRRNLALLALAVVVFLGAAVLIALSGGAS